MSMVCKLFVLKRALPKTQFIISGDFEQLLPIRDRVVGCDNKNSHALHESCNGNRIQLSTVRRANSILFDLVAPDNIPKLQKYNFTDTFTTQRVCFTNHKRKDRNTIMMETETKQKRYAKPLELKALDSDGNSQDVKLLAGTPITA